MSDTPAINTQAASFQGIGGNFDLDSMSLEDLMFFVMSKRSEVLDDSVRGYAKQIEGRNNLMKQTNDILSQARYQSANLKSGEKKEMPAEMVQFFQDQGIELPNTTKAAGGKDLSLDDQIANAEAIKNWLANDKPYTDDGCVDGDLSPEMINKARSIGIEPKDDGDGAGQNWESVDFNSFKSEVLTKLDSLKTQKTARDAEVTSAESSLATAKAELAAKPGDAALEQKVKDAQAKLDVLQGKEPAADSATAKTYTKEEWDSIVSSVQGFQEGLNNESQLDMIKFQSTMSKYTASIEMLSNVMKKLSDNASAIVRNI